MASFRTRQVAHCQARFAGFLGMGNGARTTVAILKALALHPKMLGKLQGTQEHDLVGLSAFRLVDASAG